MLLGIAVNAAVPMRGRKLSAYVTADSAIIAAARAGVAPLAECLLASLRDGLADGWELQVCDSNRREDLANAVTAEAAEIEQ